MTYCKRCGVKLRDNRGTCVLCGSPTQMLGEEAEDFYPAVRYSNRLRYLVRILALASVVLVGACLYLDFHLQSDTIWSLIVLGATIYGWTVFLATHKSYKNIGWVIFVQLIAVSLLGYVIDISTGNHGWMLNYVLPFMLIAVQGVLTAVMIAKPLLFRDFMVYELLVGGMGILSILLLLFGVAQVRWPYIAVCIYSVVILAGTALLADRKTKQELIKRFHV